MKLLLALTTLFLSTLNYAQHEFSIKLGGQTTGIEDAQIGDNQNRFGFYIGGFYNLQMKNGFSLQPELFYSYEQFNNVNISTVEYFGGIENSESTRPRFDEYYKTNQIKLPLLLRYQPSKIYVELGPQLAYLISVKGKMEDKFNEILKIEGKLEDINNLQFSIAFGGGYELNEKLDVGLRADLGITKFSEYSYIKNFSVGIGISYKIK
ncbi:porin family protein [Faecalibacter macacae]|uniref:PorT family protein n=1 Tax=Faecalibacter macacae TaxID=1859289 RepID=A0A3L9MHT4_9FLAO|nr:porin family protein [Faecalibacter macacae]RLZ12398.1 PorT family protein [Faecalibacter macacae]